MASSQRIANAVKRFLTHNEPVPVYYMPMLTSEQRRVVVHHQVHLELWSGRLHTAGTARTKRRFILGDKVKIHLDKTILTVVDVNGPMVTAAYYDSNLKEQEKTFHESLWVRV